MVKEKIYFKNGKTGYEDIDNLILPVNSKKEFINCPICNGKMKLVDSRWRECTRCGFISRNL